MIGASLSLSAAPGVLQASPLAHVPGAEIYARFDDKYGPGGISYSQGTFASATAIIENSPSGQSSATGLLVEAAATNLLASSRCDEHVGGRGTTPPNVEHQIVFDGVSCSRATFTPGNQTLFGGSRIAQDGAEHDTHFGVGEHTYSLFIGLSRELTGSEVLRYYWTGSDATPLINISAANSSLFVGKLVRLSVTSTHVASGAIYPVVYLFAPLITDVDVFVAKGQAEVGTATTSWIETAAAPVTRPAASPIVVQGPGPTLFPGAGNMDELTFALEWVGVPTGTGTARTLLNVQTQADYGASDNNRATLFYQTDGSLSLGVADTTWQGEINAGASFDDGGCHRAIVYLNRMTGDMGLSVDGGAFLTDNKAGSMPISFDVVAIGHKKSGVGAADHSRGNHLEIAAAGGDHRVAWAPGQGQ